MLTGFSSSLGQVREVSATDPLPIDDKGTSSSVGSASAETVQLYYSNAGVMTADAGQAAGTMVYGKLTYDNLKNAAGAWEASYGDSSLSFTSTALTAEVSPATVGDDLLTAGRLTSLFSALSSKLSNGQYIVYYAKGLIIGKKADNSTSLTNTAYKYNSGVSGGAVTIADGACVTLGAKADARSTATDTTAVTIMQVLKEISYMEQNPASRAVTNAGTFAVQNTSAAVGMFFDSDADNTAQVLKAAAGTLYKVHAVNTNVAAAYIQLFNVAAGSVTVGVTAPNYVIYVPPSGAVTEDFVHPLNFATAITYAATTTATGAGDPTTGLTVSAAYL